MSFSFSIPVWQKLLLFLEEGENIHSLSRVSGVSYSHVHNVVHDLLVQEGFVRVESVGREKKLFLNPLGLEWQVFLRSKYSGVDKR